MFRCESRIGNHSIQFHAQPEPVINEWEHSWPPGEISYRLNNSTTDITNESMQKRAVTVALRVWQLRISDLKFRQERNKDVKVDFNVDFKPVGNFSSSNVLAHAWYPGQGDISGDCEINDEWDWVTHSALQNMGQPPLVPILIHEFGHSLGLTHDTDESNAIMYPSFNLGRKKNQLHQRDIDRIQARYGKRSISQRIIDYFQNRRDQGFDFR